MDARIESRLQWLEAARQETLEEIGKLWEYAAKTADAAVSEPEKYAQPLGADELSSRKKTLEKRLEILKEISQKNTLKEAIYILSIKAKMACDRLYDIDDGLQEYRLALAEYSECTHMISMLV